MNRQDGIRFRDKSLISQNLSRQGVDLKDKTFDSPINSCPNFSFLKLILTNQLI